MSVITQTITCCYILYINVPIYMYFSKSSYLLTFVTGMFHFAYIVLILGVYVAYNVNVGERGKYWRQEGVDPGGELMIISSFGDNIDPTVEYTAKSAENLPHTNLDNKTMERKVPTSLVHQELDLLLDKIKGVKSISLTYVCMDIPAAQFSRDYYLERIKVFLEENTKKSGKRTVPF